jgi:hypothetical protein
MSDVQGQTGVSAQLPKVPHPWFSHTFDPLPEGPPTICNDVPESRLIKTNENQTPHAHVTAKIEGYKYVQDPNDLNCPVEQFVLVDLSGQGNGVDPGKLAYQGSNKCGAFTDRVQVQISFLDEPRLLVRASAPDTISESGSVSSSSSKSFSIDGGFLGPAGMGTLTGSWSISMGFSQSIEDFAIENSTIGTGNTAGVHVYSLRMLHGGTYSTPEDVLKYGGWQALPSRAKSDLPIYSCVLFHSPVEIDATRTLHIQLVHRVMIVEYSFNHFDGFDDLPADTVPEDWDEPRRFGGRPPSYVLGYCTPTLIKRDWYLQVDLKNAGVVLCPPNFQPGDDLLVPGDPQVRFGRAVPGAAVRPGRIGRIVPGTHPAPKPGGGH